MKLSVIIVNYNVKYFLEQCLYSVYKAAQNLDYETEIIVVDNNSVDGSVEMLNTKFHKVKLIVNKQNKGFAKANNQAIKISKSEYILLLNPDTVVEDTTFKKVIAFMDSHPEAGALGVKMLDGKGKFLPESKRGLPTPSVALYKISGLSKIFPRSKIFGKYHLGFLDKNEINEVEILSGAFMLIRKKALDKTGLLDESFFMYGEDIDISYRLIKQGYKNYYFPKTRIIHYKGESTKKSSINYVMVFYNAMIIFAKKHFSHKNANLFSSLIKTAIYLRASFAIISRFLKKIMLPLTDAIVIFIGIYFIKNYWEQNIIFPNGGHYPVEFITIAVPVYILIWLVSAFFAGVYEHYIKLIKIFKGITIGTLIILVIYALMPEYCRFSRALILIGSLWSVVSMSIIRLFINILNIKNYKTGTNKNRRFAIIGKENEAQRVEKLLKQTNINANFIRLINISKSKIKNDIFIGNINQIKEIIEVYKIDELIFCAKDISAQDIIDQMSKLQYFKIDFKIAPPESYYIIGSKSINTQKDLYIVDLNSVSKPINKRNKRLFDIITCIILLAISPVSAFFIKNPVACLKNIFLILIAKKTWVGYYNITKTESNLPKIRKSVLNTADAFKNKNISDRLADKINILYARDYKMINDLNIIIKGFKYLGRTEK